jgi:predicted ATPase/DNA-binding SARP family transcriptional activator
VELRVLGDFEVLGPNERLRLGGLKQRGLLALLALDAGKTVSRGRLLEGLWDDPPATAGHSIQVYVSSLRARLREVDREPRISTRGDGYLLRLESDELDLARFEQLAAEARQAGAIGQHEEASALFREALDLWRGDALADLRELPFAEPEARRLDELRLTARQEWVDCELALGRHAGVVEATLQLVEAEPLRERLRGQLMLALYRSGRQAEALAVYREGRIRSVAELGLEPSRELRALEQAILAQDPALVAVPPVRRRPRLPEPQTRLVGRQREIREIEALLGRPKIRLVTVTGTGGSGKTRVALAAARRLDAALGEPRFVDLACVAVPEQVLPAIAQALGLRESLGRPILDSLRAALTDRPLLLVLDNFEHVLPAAESLSALIGATTRLKVLTTSRTRLRITGERELAVGPLSLRDSVELFVERADAGGAAVPTAYPRLSIVEAICERLDGLPLALELAAARLRCTTCEELLTRLDRRLPLLGDGPADVPERQRTLRAAIDWSHELLSEDERDLFARLSVFAGPFTLDAAERVCDAPLPVLAALLDKSMIVRVRAGSGERRTQFAMLETLREYARERLQQSEHRSTVSRRLLSYALQLAEDGTRGLRSSEHRSWEERLRAELGTLRSAVEHALRANAEVAQRLCSQLAWPWIVMHLYDEGLSATRRALALGPSLSETRAGALVGEAVLALRRGETDAVRRASAEALELQPPPLWRAGALMNLSHLTVLAGDPERAMPIAADALDAARECGDAWHEAWAHYSVSIAAWSAGDLELAYATSLESIRLHETTGDTRALCGMKSNHAELLLDLGRADEAELYIDAAETIAQDLGDSHLWLYPLVNRVALELLRGRLERAREALWESAKLAEELGDTLAEADCWIAAAVVCALDGDREGAVELWSAGTRAVEVEGAFLSIRRLRLDVLEPLRDQLSTARFSAAWERGAALPLDSVRARVADTVRPTKAAVTELRTAISRRRPHT